MVLLEAKNLSKTFVLETNLWGKATKTLQAVKNVSFDLHEGECLCLVGESGCGKSTLARLVTRLIDADHGSVQFLDNDFLTLSKSKLRTARKDMQMVFQNPFSSLDPRYTIQQSIAEPLEIHNWGTKEEIQARVLELIKLVELDETMLAKYPHQCSGGQNQRVCIARALALNPKIIVADEAVSALDVSIQWKVLELIKKLQAELGISFLFIAHNLGVVRKIADRVAVMYAGEIVEFDETESIFENPQHDYTKVLLSAAPIKDPRKRGQKPQLDPNNPYLKNR